MRVLHLIPLISTNAEYGGPAGGTLHLADELQAQGAQVHVGALWRGKKPTVIRPSGVRLITWRAYHLPFTHRFAGLVSLSSLVWVLRHARRFDIVHVHAGRELWVLIAMLALRILRVPYVVQTHGMLVARQSPKHRLYDYLLTSRALQGAALVLYLTNYERDQLGAFRSIRRVRYFPNAAMDVATFPAERKPSSALRIVSISRLHPRKRVPDLVEAASILNSFGTAVEVDIYGPDAGDLAHITAAILRCEASDYVHYRGALEYDAVKTTLRRYDVFVLAAEGEPFPYSLLEAMSEGLACVSTTACGLASHIQTSNAGVVVEPGVAPIAQALATLADERLRTLLGSDALALCRGSFAVEKVAGLAKQYYVEAATAHSPETTIRDAQSNSPLRPVGQ